MVNNAIIKDKKEFFMKATANAFKKYPALNSEFDSAKNRLVLKKYYNIGIAVINGGILNTISNSRIIGTSVDDDGVGIEVDGD